MGWPVNKGCGGQAAAACSYGLLPGLPLLLQGNMTLTGVMDVLWHKDKPERLFIHGKVRRVKWVDGRGSRLLME